LERIFLGGVWSVNFIVRYILLISDEIYNHINTFASINFRVSKKKHNIWQTFAFGDFWNKFRGKTPTCWNWWWL